MERFQQARGLGIVAWMTIMVCVTLAWVTGCSRQLAVPGSAGTPDRKQLPFDRISDNRGISPTAAFASEAIPAGTEVTVRLRLALSSADSRAGDSFEAVLDEPLVVAGKNIVPPSSLVTGRVVATKAGGLYDPGYLRLTLASIAINGKPFPMQTSSIFARGRSYEKRKHSASTFQSGSDGEGLASGPVVDSAPANQTPRAHNPADVKFSTGHRFTFRLAQPLLLQD